MLDLTHGEIITLLGFCVSTLGAAGLLLWRGGRWTDRIERSVEHVATQVGIAKADNSNEHRVIGETLVEHGERLCTIEKHAVQLPNPPRSRKRHD